MIIKPKTRGFICTTAHPEGCAAFVKEMVDYSRARQDVFAGKNVLVIGASMGYGLAARITAAFSGKAATLGVIFDKAGAEGRTGSAGWYNTAAFEELAAADGLYAKTVNGDAYSDDIKKRVIDIIKKDLGSVDTVIYSLAAPRRTMPDGTVYSSVLKTVGEPFTNKSIDLRTNHITEVTIEPATAAEVEATIKVMGGEDWEAWIEALSEAGVLAPNARTVAFSYIGPELTHAIYKNGSIGQAKKHLFETSKALTKRFSAAGLKAYISVNKALVTQSSAAIPIVPLYISILYKIMKKNGSHEGCIEQMHRLFAQKLSDGAVLDENGMIRLDDWEMRDENQNAVRAAWETISEETLGEVADLDGFWSDFYGLFGFGAKGVDYESDVSPEVKIKSIID